MSVLNLALGAVTEAGQRREALRLGEELLIPGSAATALVAAGCPSFGVALAGISTAHDVLLCSPGQRPLSSPSPRAP